MRLLACIAEELSVHSRGLEQEIPKSFSSNSRTKIVSLAVRDTPLNSASADDVAGNPGWVWVVTWMTAPCTGCQCCVLSPHNLPNHDESSMLRCRREQYRRAELSQVSDPELWMQLHHHGIPESSTSSDRELKGKGKGKGLRAKAMSKAKAKTFS